MINFDSRPVKIRKGKEDRSLLKLARKKIQTHVADLAVSIQTPPKRPQGAWHRVEIEDLESRALTYIYADTTVLAGGSADLGRNCAYSCKDVEGIH